MTKITVGLIPEKSSYIFLLIRYLLKARNVSFNSYPADPPPVQPGVQVKFLVQTPGDGANFLLQMPDTESLHIPSSFINRSPLVLSNTPGTRKKINSQKAHGAGIFSCKYLGCPRGMVKERIE